MSTIFIQGHLIQQSYFKESPVNGGGWTSHTSLRHFLFLYIPIDNYYYLTTMTDLLFINDFRCLPDCSFACGIVLHLVFRSRLATSEKFKLAAKSITTALGFRSITWTLIYLFIYFLLVIFLCQFRTWSMLFWMPSIPVWFSFTVIVACKVK